MRPNAPESIRRLLLKGGRLIDPEGGRDETVDLLIERSRIMEIGQISPGEGEMTLLDCTGKVIAPGFCDMHVHLREPGEEEKETIETGCRAAMAGGFTAITAMPNTKPPLDTRGQIEYVLKKAVHVAVHPVGAITKGLKGEELTEMAELVEAGAVAFSDDGRPVSDAGRFRRALEYAKMFDRVLIEHSEERSLTEGGQMHEGRVSTRLGLKGIPSIGETVAVSRNLLIAEYVGAPLHIAHVSTAGAVALIREAKARGVAVTAETCPHYLVLTDERVATFDPNRYKMNPPLRTEDDRQALIEGLRDGTIDAIATDHAPHTVDDKDCEFDAAAFGVVGLETAVGVILTALVHPGLLSLSDMVMKMSVHPRRILRLKPIRIAPGEEADLTLLDPQAVWTVKPDLFQSKGWNTPFAGETLIGAPYAVISKGKIAFSRLAGQ